MAKGQLAQLNEALFAQLGKLESAGDDVLESEAASYFQKRWKEEFCEALKGCGVEICDT